MKRVYFQRRDDDLGTGRVDVATLGAPPPPLLPERINGQSKGARRGLAGADVGDEETSSSSSSTTSTTSSGGGSSAVSAAGEWEMWVELYNEDYHASPVRVRPSQVGLRTVGAEIGEALLIAVPVAFFWAAVSASFVITSLNDPTNVTLK